MSAKLSRSAMFAVLARKIPFLFNANAVKTLAAKNELSIEDASEALNSVDQKMDDRIIDAHAKMVRQQFYGAVKFEAMLAAAKEDERLLYDEFLRVDNDRDKIIAQINERFNGDFNALLNVVKTSAPAEDVQVSEIEKLSRVKIVPA